jgi:hypothetical protein
LTTLVLKDFRNILIRKRKEDFLGFTEICLKDSLRQVVGAKNKQP